MVYYKKITVKNTTSYVIFSISWIVFLIRRDISSNFLIEGDTVIVGNSLLSGNSIRVCCVKHVD